MSLEGIFIISYTINNRGSFAIVKSAVNKKTGERVAIKIFDR